MLTPANGLTISGGTLAPGNSPGAMDITGDISGSGTFTMEIASLVSLDHVNVTGTMNLSGATIDVDLLSFSPTAGQSFDLFDFTGSIGGTWSFDFTNAALGSGLAWDTSAFASSGSISVLLTTVIPEPSGLALLMGAGAMLRLRRRAR